MQSLRAFRDYRRLVSWEHEVLHRGITKESYLSKVMRQIPWSGVAMMGFVMVFFGIDLGAGVKYTAQRMKEKKEEAMNSPEVKKYQAKGWAVDQVKQFRDGDTERKRDDSLKSDFVPLVPEGQPRPSYGAPKSRNAVF